jgi:hypothetical protein
MTLAILSNSSSSPLRPPEGSRTIDFAGDIGVLAVTTRRHSAASSHGRAIAYHALMGRLNTGEWLDRNLVWRVAMINAAIGAAMLLFLTVTATGTVDVYGRPLGTDFSVFWNAGHLANGGQAPAAWDPNVLNATAHRTHGADVGDSAWLYPPVFLLIASPLAALPYVPALILWQVLSLAALAAALCCILPDRRAVLVALASPLTPLVLTHGQNAFLTAALLGGGLALLGRMPWRSGGLLGCLLYKPQLGIILAPALLFTRNWRAIVAAGVTASLLGLLSLAIWGPDAWAAFLGSLRLGRGFMELGAVGFHKSASLFAMTRQWGAGVGLSYGVQAIGMVAALVVVWRLREADADVRSAGVCAAVALSTPYLLDYDMATVGIGAAFLYAAGARTQFLPYERSALALVWIAPWFSRPAAQFLTVPLGPIVMILLAALALRRAAVRSSPSRHSRAASAP